MSSWMRSRTRLARRTCASSAACTCPAETTSCPASPARWSASRSRSATVSAWTCSLSASAARREACSIARTTAPRSRGRSPSRRAKVPRSLRVELLALARPLDLLLEVGGHLEELGELGVELGEHVVEVALAEEHHLGLQGDRLRLERRGRGQAERLPDRLDPDHLRAQRPLQLVPGQRLQEQPPGVHDQVAAVRAVQRPRLDQREVGDEVAELRHVLDAAHEVGVGRVVLVDDGGPARRGLGRRAR